MVQRRLDERGWLKELPQQRAIMSKECLKLKDRDPPTMDFSQWLHLDSPC